MDATTPDRDAIGSMWILDGQRYWAFLKAYVIVFIALVGLYVVIDAFSNLDEFTEVTEGLGELAGFMGWYYLVRMSLFYDRLCGVIAMMAAIFTVTWMQKNNELIAILAAGIGTRRVIRPVLISALAVNLLAVANQEFVMSRLGDELQKSSDDDGKLKKPVGAREDVNGIRLQGKDGDRETQTVTLMEATIPVSLAGRLMVLTAERARYIPEDDPGRYRGGWLFRDAVLSPEDRPVDGELAGLLVKLDAEALKSLPPVGEGPKVKPWLNLKRPARADAAEGIYFLRTNVSFETMTRKRDWYLFASTPELMSALADPSSAGERLEIAVFLHGRILRPFLGLALMGLSLPLVLGGDGRNMFVNLGLSLGTSALFYGSLFMFSYLANNDVLTPILASWVPLIAFGTLAVARWGTIRT